MNKRPDFLDCPNRGEERRRIERMMSRCFIVYWFVLVGGYCFVPDESYLTRKMSLLPELVFPSNPPSV